QVVDDAAHAGALPGVVPRVARLHEVVDLARQGHHAFLHIDLDAVRVDPGVLVHVREHRVPDLVVGHAAFGLVHVVQVVAGAGAAVGRCRAVSDVGVALEVLRPGERALIVLLAVGAETAGAPPLALELGAHVLLLVAREGGPGIVAHPACLRHAAGLLGRPQPPPAAAPRRLAAAVAEATPARLPVPAVLVAVAAGVARPAAPPGLVALTAGFVLAVVAPARGRHAAAQRPPPAGARRGARAARAAAGQLPTVLGHGRILLAGHGRPEQRGRGGIATILPRGPGGRQPAARLSASPILPYLCPYWSPTPGGGNASGWAAIADRADEGCCPPRDRCVRGGG